MRKVEMIDKIGEVVKVVPRAQLHTNRKVLVWWNEAMVANTLRMMTMYKDMGQKTLPLQVLWAQCVRHIDHQVNEELMDQDEALLDWIYDRDDENRLDDYAEEVFMVIGMLQRVVLDDVGHDADERGEVACALYSLTSSWSMGSYRVCYNLWKEYVRDEEEI